MASGRVVAFLLGACGAMQLLHLCSMVSLALGLTPFLLMFTMPDVKIVSHLRR